MGLTFSALYRIIKKKQRGIKMRKIRFVLCALISALCSLIVLSGCAWLLGEENSIPPSLQTVGYSAFYDCTNLKDVYVTDLVSWCKIFFEDSTANPMYYAQNFYLDGELLTELIIPE